MSADRTFALKVRKIGNLLRHQIENLEKREVPAVSAWWGDLGVGTPASTGATTTGANGTITVEGSGSGYSQTSDQFHYRFKEMAGDGFVTARVTSVTDADASAAGSLMIRGGYAANSPFAALTRNPSGGWSFQLRGAPGGMVSSATYAGPAANFAKLVRNGPLFSGYVSASGQEGTWSLVGTGSFAAGRTVSIGVSVAALGSSGLASAVFENLTIADPPAIGAGLDSVIDWSYSNAFVDMTKQARQFMTAEGFQPIATDANGWATADHLIIFQSGAANQSHIYNGTYKLSFKGQATIDKWVSPATVTNVVYNASTNTTTADVTLNAPSTDWYLGIVFRNTKRTPTSAVGTGVTDVKLIRPGFNPASHPTFTSQFTDHLKRFTTLRFMDWLETNASHVVNWSDRTPGDYARQTKAGVSWEHCVELANLLGKDMWINIPHQATNDYVTQVATYIKNNLRPDLAVYVEWSNEVWNWGFEQTGWNYNKAQAEVQAGGSQLNFDGETNGGYLAWRRTAQRTKEVSDIFKTVWGAAAINTRVRVVLAGQSANPETFRQGLHYLNGVYGNASNYIYALAGAPYFSLGAADNANNLTTDQVIAGLQAAQQAAPSTMQYAQCVAAAYANGLKFVAYEGGPDTFGANNIQAKKQAMLDPRMKQIVDDYLTQWFDAGGGLFNWFVAGATSWDSPYGTWGLTNDPTNPNTPKTQGIDAVLARSTPLFNDGLALPGEYSPRATVGAVGATGNRYAGAGDKMQYLLCAPTDGQYTFKIRYATDVAGRSLRIAVNGQVVTTINLPTTPTWDTFVDSATVNLNLTNGPSVLEITVLGGGLQLGNLKFGTGVTQSIVSKSGNTLTADVDAFNGVMPSGSVQFYDGATMVGSANLDTSGRASLNLAGTPTGNRIYKAVYSGNTTHLSSTSPGLSAAGTGTNPPPPVAAPAVQSMVINDGSAQRSSVRSLTVTFDKLVTLLSGAFELTLVNGTAPTVNVTTTASNGRTIATLTFSGTGVVNGSLADGLYSLRIVASRVQDASNELVFMTADRVESLHRLFGDIDGDRDVDSNDYGTYRQNYGATTGANAAYDYNGDGDVDADDFRQFTLRYGRRV